MKPGLYRYTGILALAVLALVGEATARDLDQDEALRLRREGSILPLEQLIQTALGRYPGRCCWRSSWKRRTASWFTRWSC